MTFHPLGYWVGRVAKLIFSHTFVGPGFKVQAKDANGINAGMMMIYNMSYIIEPSDVPALHNLSL